jgi:hypothetical protein
VLEGQGLIHVCLGTFCQRVSKILLGFQGSYPGDDWGQLAAGFGLVGVTGWLLVLIEVRLS